MDKTNKSNISSLNTVIKGGYFTVTPKPSEPLITNGTWGTAMPSIAIPYENKKQQHMDKKPSHSTLRDKTK